MDSIRHVKRIVVPQRSVNGGLAFKFETEAHDVQLHGFLTPEQYTEAIENLNRKLRPSRAGAIDGALLVTGPLLVPLALWGVRHRSQTKKRKRLLKEGMHEFNVQYQELVMRWNRKPAQSVLVIEPRHQSTIVSENPIGYVSQDRDVGSVREEPMPVAQATLLAAPATAVYGFQQQQQQQLNRAQLRVSSQRRSGHPHQHQSVVV